MPIQPYTVPSYRAYKDSCIHTSLYFKTSLITVIINNHKIKIELRADIHADHTSDITSINHTENKVQKLT